MKTDRLPSLSVMLGLVFLVGLGAGCATHVTVNSNPPGADIYARGSGRPAYRWEYRGKAPAEFKSYYTAIKAVAKWPDGKQSEVVRARTAWKGSVELTLEPSPDAVPVKDVPAAPTE